MPVVNAVPVNVAGTTIQARLHLVAGVLRNVLLTTLWTARRASVLLLCLLVQLGTMGVAKNVPRIVLTAVHSASVKQLVVSGIRVNASRISTILRNPNLELNAQIQTRQAVRR